MTSPLDSLVPQFLQHLRIEEQLLCDTTAKQGEIHAALCRGDLPAVAAGQLTQEAAAQELREAEAARVVSLAELARVVGLAPDGLTLTALAGYLPDPWAGEIRATRERLAAAAAELDEIRTRNANLIGHLRSYFRGVLASLTSVDAPVRYGPSGSQLSAAVGGAFKARG